MASLNQVQLIGCLGADPQVRYLPDGTPTVTVSVATNERWKVKQSGEVKESTEWHRVVFFGKLAEVAGQFLKKGSEVFVSGRNKTRKWKDEQGNERYVTEVFARQMQMLGKRKDAVPVSDATDSAPPVPPGGDGEFEDDQPF